MSPAEVRSKLREETLAALPPELLDPLDQTDDDTFALFDVGDEDG